MRIYLKRPTAADEAEYRRVAVESQNFHYPWVQPTSTDFPQYIARCETDAFEGLWARRLEDDALVGVFNLSQIFRGGFCNAYLGFWASLHWKGRGLMREALELVLDETFGPLRLHRLEANIQPDNEPSRQLVKRVGFRLEGFSPRYLKLGGEWRDHERWAITAEDRG